MSILSTFMRTVRGLINIASRHEYADDDLKLLLGAILSRQNQQLERVQDIGTLEFRVFSQFGDDGIIDWLTRKLPITKKIFVEFGVENYKESNTRFLLESQNWSGLVIDGSDDHVRAIQSAPYYWKFDLRAVSSFITRENIDQLFSSNSICGEIGLLHIDIDGNDYWVWDVIQSIAPQIVIMEYNALFGFDRAITIPYSPDFVRSKAHHSYLYAGASLRALELLGIKKGYRLIGCNSAGNNAYFLKGQLGIETIPTLTSSQAFQLSKFRELRSREGKLLYPHLEERIEAIRGLKVVNVESGENELI